MGTDREELRKEVTEIWWGGMNVYGPEWFAQMDNENIDKMVSLIQSRERAAAERVLDRIENVPVLYTNPYQHPVEIRAQDTVIKRVQEEIAAIRQELAQEAEGRDDV